MEPLRSTYSQPLVSGFAAGRNAGESRRAIADPAVSKTEDIRSRGISSGNIPEQQGVRTSEQTVEEFRPYSGSSSQSKDGTGDTNNSQSDIPSADGTLGKEDPQVQAEIARLKAIEEKVKAHEAAHKSAGGTMTGPVSYSYTRGPDNRNYITGGEVQISMAPGKTPQETVSRMQQVIRAALAPADPSPQDRAVAAQAAVQQQEARQQQAAASSSSPEKPPATAETAQAATLEPRNQPGSIAARDSQRAYGNPAVTGKQTENPVSADPLAGPRGAAAPLTAAAGSPQPAISSDDVNGYGAAQSVSYYA